MKRKVNYETKEKHTEKEIKTKREEEGILSAWSSIPNVVMRGQIRSYFFIFRDF